MFTPYVGTVYKFTFISPFNSFNGIYKVLRIMTFDEVQSDQIDLSEIYTLSGKTVEDYDNDAIELRKDRILKLEDINNSSSIRYIPMSFGETEPDPNVKKYATLALAVNLGVYDNKNQVAFVKDTIQSIVAKSLGVEDSVYLFTMRDVWMSVSEYNQKEAERIEKKESLINLYSEVLRLRKDLDSANTKISYYEDLLVKLSEKE